MKRRTRQRLIAEFEKPSQIKGVRVKATWWYFSFADPNLPEGTQFLGACLVKAAGEMNAITATHMFCINPGGEAQFVELPGDPPPEMPTWRLMQREEIDAVDAMVVAREAIEGHH